MTKELKGIDEGLSQAKEIIQRIRALVPRDDKQGTVALGKLAQHVDLVRDEFRGKKA